MQFLVNVKFEYCPANPRSTPDEHREYFPADKAQVDPAQDISLGDTALFAAKHKYPDAFCSLVLDTRGKSVRKH